ncbi:MAG: hypothetical protein NWS63_08325, partial [Saprospiraceae bacterium]|nr:hypothetical protein [Saprospiraceae bacterium]
MSEKKVHQPLPLDSLFVFLEAHGFRTDPARRFRLLRVLYSRGWSELGEDGFQTLKYRLAPFVITSADEQERFYALFDQWLAEAEQEAVLQQDDEVEQPVVPAGSQPRRLFLPAMLGTGIVMAFLAVYFFGSPPLPRIQERRANLVEGTPVSFSASLDWRQSPKHLGWRLIGASTDTLLAGQPAFSFVTPVGAGDTLQLVLMYRGAVTDSLFLPVFCATPPEIKGLSLPEAIVANQEFSLGVSLDSGLMAQWV